MLLAIISILLIIVPFFIDFSLLLSGIILCIKRKKKVGTILVIIGLAGLISQTAFITNAIIKDNLKKQETFNNLDNKIYIEDENSNIILDDNTTLVLVDYLNNPNTLGVFEDTGYNLIVESSKNSEYRYYNLKKLTDCPVDIYKGGNWQHLYAEEDKLDEVWNYYRNTYSCKIRKINPSDSEYIEVDLNGEYMDMFLEYWRLYDNIKDSNCDEKYYNLNCYQITVENEDDTSKLTINIGISNDDKIYFIGTSSNQFCYELENEIETYFKNLLSMTI